MKLNQLFFAVLLLPCCLLAAQPVDAERKAFDDLYAKANKGDAEAQFQVGSMYATGTGVAKSLSKAATWHRKAADQGLARAQLQVGLEYANGVGIKADQAEAFKWVQKAASQKLAEAQYNLGVFFANGIGARESQVEAARFYRLAAEQGLAGGEYELGRCYLEGNGVPKDIVEALKWIRIAAGQGYAPAEDRLGQCYMKGEGVTKDYLQAYKWFNLAAAQGGEDSDYTKVNLAKVEHLLTPEQVTEGQRLAREFKPAKAAPLPASQASPPSESNYGLVNVRASDATCEVYADGAFRGNSPALIRLPEGSHIIEVKKAGFKDYRRELRVTEGSDQTLLVTLEKQ